MELSENVILINGVDKTFAIESIRFNQFKFEIKFRNTAKTYSYSHEKIVWIKHPVTIDASGCHILIKGKRANQVKELKLFVKDSHKYYALTYSDDITVHFKESDIDIRRSCLEGKAVDIFDYLKRCSEINTLGIDEDDESSEGILSSIYSKIDFIDDATAAAPYMNPSQGWKKRRLKTPPIFPFGCNASQQQAVIAALTNQISVIQGPPGTGKTQTILNIIANLLKDKKTVLVVSNNNSATENVLEKLAKNGLGFLVAPLGNRENKEAFIANQPTINPDLPKWSRSKAEIDHAYSEAAISLEKVKIAFSLQERLASCRQELADVEVEMRHYCREHSIDFNSHAPRISSTDALKLSQSINSFIIKYQGDTKGLANSIIRFVKKLGITLRLRYFCSIKEELTPESLPKIIAKLDRLFYLSRTKELKAEIESLETKLTRLNYEDSMKSLTANSMTVLKAAVADRFKTGRKNLSSVSDIYRNSEDFLNDYPIILSTTFSAKTCFGNDTIIDYVIMDEASQVSVDTGFLALSCAKNAVIVGDTMQLPNVTTDDDRIKLDNIRLATNIPDAYDMANHSFLSSILAAIPGVAMTLLREHYRCHPDIINFCNQKFYGGNLLIMTRRDDSEKHLLALTTSPGQHCRGHYNQREIDAVKIELLPLVNDLDQTGIIAPYNQQVAQFRSQIPEIEAATVHKYQGREKDTIIMSVTDDTISEFADNANLLNVAVSRAKTRFCLVATGNKQELNGNIHDLLNYIKYQQGIIIESKLRSIFDYLFTHIHEYNRASTDVSPYKSENLTFSLIEKIQTTYPHLSHIKALCHYPLRYLIRDTRGLSDREIKYAMHPATHIDFLIINRVTKLPLLAIETDGYSYHNEDTEQYRRDRLKDNILAHYGLPILRLSTIGHSEEQRIVEMLSKTQV